MAILDAEKEAFLRSPTSLSQLRGREAPNVNGRVVMYADTMTAAMQNALNETDRRRVKQRAYNAANGITPETIVKAVRRGLESELAARKTAREGVETKEPEHDIDELVTTMNEEMLKAAANLDFEQAAGLRDQVQRLRQRRGELELSGLPARARRSDYAPGEKRRSDRGGGKAPGTPGSRSGKKRRS